MNAVTDGKEKTKGMLAPERKARTETRHRREHGAQGGIAWDCNRLLQRGVKGKGYF